MFLLRILRFFLSSCTLVEQEFHFRSKKTVSVIGTKSHYMPVTSRVQVIFILVANLLQLSERKCRAKTARCWKKKQKKITDKISYLKNRFNRAKYVIIRFHAKIMTDQLIWTACGSILSLVDLLRDQDFWFDSILDSNA